jgi:hypothetical protein
MKHAESSLPVVAEIAEIIGGLAIIFALIQGIRSWLRPIKVSCEISVDRVLVKVKVRRPDNIAIKDAGISVSKRRFGVQVKERFFGFGLGKQKLSLIVERDRVSKKDGLTIVAHQPILRIRSVAEQCAINLAPPIWSYVRYDDSQVMFGHRIRFTKLLEPRTSLGERTGFHAK